MADKVPSQCNRVLEYIKNNDGITRWIALQELGVANLPAVINKLRKRGYCIGTEDCVGKNRYGQTITFARYYEEVDE